MHPFQTRCEERRRRRSNFFFGIKIDFFFFMPLVLHTVFSFRVKVTAKKMGKLRNTNSSLIVFLLDPRKLQKREDKVRIINDPLGQIHSLTRSDHYFQATFVLCYFTDVRTEPCAKIMITTGRDCGSAEWINFKQEKRNRQFFKFRL